MGRMRAVIVAPLLLLTASCSPGDEDVRPAIEAFKRFQTAVLRGDRDALRHMVTLASTEVVPHLPLESAADKQPLQVIGAFRRGYRVHVDVSDPNQGGAPARFVMAKEHGIWVLDLLDTTSFNHELVESGDYTFKPLHLTPAEIERIRSQHPDVIR